MKTYTPMRLLLCALMSGALAASTGCSPANPDLESVCGDGVTEGREECDNGSVMNSDVIPNSCRTTCIWYFCGDGVMDVGEECDDGNNVSGDGCSELCVHQILCGDGIVEGTEQCDDGNNTSGDGCSGGCILEWVCGDGLCETERQENCPACPEDCCPCGDGSCDQGMGETCSLCQSDCCPDCGDGFLDLTEQCDDGNNTDNDGCSAGCLDEDGTSTCGNGIWEAGEGCEDGNTTAGDGCSDVCQVEYVCGDGNCESGFGETCQICQPDCCPHCGNGVLELADGEECDTSDFGGVTCQNSCYTGGTPSCTNYCTLDMSTCTGTLPVCGNGTVECGEDCDTTDLGGNDCYTFGLDGGTLACDSGCNYDTSGCGALLWYFFDDFEDPISVALWTLGGDWQSGTPTHIDEPSPHSGTTVIGTIIGGPYNTMGAYLTDLAATPPINLTVAVAPMLRFYMWVDTETGWDCGALFIDAGSGFQHTTADVAYDGTEGGYACWQGPDQVWLEVTKDLTSYVGQTIRIGFGFYSDSSFQYEGWYIDDVIVGEPGALP